MALTSGGKTFNIGGLFASYAMTEDENLKKVLQKSLNRAHWDPTPPTKMAFNTATRW